MNKVIISGVLIKDPVVFHPHSDNSKTVTTYTLAVDDHSSASPKEGSAFINCTAFGPAAVFAQKHLHKGTYTNVIGKLKTNSYTNSKGEKIHTTYVQVSDLEVGITLENSFS